MGSVGGSASKLTTLSKLGLIQRNGDSELDQTPFMSLVGSSPKKLR